ncbi:MAG TPA: tRNA-specific adenosine deaminase [Clostridiales bacterium]|nr:MAG: tRNA-specific adenosine deaminase [Clostridiales bacterium GWD2_32_19]HCC07868.1 tRNA-specific adenosine deaminase [Clostridiales bacterium]
MVKCVIGDDIYYMKKALVEANKAFKLEEIPIGAIIVYDGKIIGRGYNVRNFKKNPLGHAELIAISKASKYIDDWRLENCTMYVTVEPCPMCAGAIVQSRIKKLVYGCDNPKAGCCGSILNIVHEPKFNHQVEVLDGVLEKECSELMKVFFGGLREKISLLKEKDNNSNIK